MTGNLRELFPEQDQLVVACGVLDHYRALRRNNQKPIGPDNSAGLVAHFKYLWREYVEEGRVNIASVSSKEWVGAVNVINRLPKILERLTQEGFLEKIGEGYQAVLSEED